jgi:hypothetical protein
VRLHHHGRPAGHLRFVRRQPAQLRDGLPRLRHRTHRLDPGPPPPQRVQQVCGRDLRPLVVAVQGRAHRRTLRVQGYDTVLLRGDPDGLHILQQPTGRRLSQGEQPGLRVDVVAFPFALAGMRSVTLPQHGSGVSVTDHDASELGRAVQSGDYPHDPELCRMLRVPAPGRARPLPLPRFCSRLARPGPSSRCVSLCR